MNTLDKSPDKLGFLLRNQEFLIAVGLWLWLGIFQVTELKQGFWGTYFCSLLVTGVVQLPGLIFAWFKPRLQTVLPIRQYLGIWAGCFLISLPVITICYVWWLPINYDSFLFISAALSSFALELLLTANQYYQKRVKHITWIKKIGLENAVLASLILIALVLSAMAVSSMDDPAYDSPQQLLIGFEFSPFKIFKYWWAFLSFSVQFLLMYLSGYLFFFINNRFLVSKILKQKGLLTYLLSVLGTVAFLYPIVGQLLLLLPINQVFGRDIFLNNPFSLENAFGVLAIMLLSLPIVLALQWAKQNTRIVSLEKEKAQTELDLLKQQLNPHFFFNTLNNLYALSLQKSEKTSESILQLSELMRYVIYKGQKEAAPLTEEIKYMKDYIQLQQMRLKKPLNFTFKQDIAHDNLTIAPLLLIVLVENAFKHGIEPAEDMAVLNLYLSYTDKALYFSCENSVEPVEVTKGGGIGLLNLKRRLELLYPDRYLLNTAFKNGIFKAELQLILK